MTTRVPAIALALLIPAALVTVALGQPSAVTPLPAPAPPPRYQVEVLIFANRDFDRSEEHFEDEQPVVVPRYEFTLREPPYFDELSFEPLALDGVGETPVSEADAVADAQAETQAEAVVEAEPEVRLLRPEELQLNAEYRTVERVAAYTPLLHGGWVQSGLPEEESQPFDLALLSALNPRGTIRLHLSRFLHVSLDLTYQEPLRTAGPQFSNELAELPIAPRYRLVTTRQARSGELHYFDHPAFGVLIKITPAPAATTGTPAPASGRPAA
jgi:hypothetical protein